MIPAVPLTIRILMSSALMLAANGLAWAAGWVTPEIDVDQHSDAEGGTR